MHTILFDLDDTLVNTTETIMKRINKIAKKYPISTSDLKYIHDLLPNPERITILSKKYSFSKEIFSCYESLRNEIVVSPIVNVKSLFDWFKFKNIDIGILTNNNYIKSKFKLSQCNVSESDLNGKFYHSDNLTNLKPDPRCFDIIFQNSKNNRLFYVGDAIIDYEASKNAGVYFIAVSSGLNSKEDFIQAGLPKHKILKNVEGLYKIIEEIQNE